MRLRGGESGCSEGVGGGAGTAEADLIIRHSTIPHPRCGPCQSLSRIVKQLRPPSSSSSLASSCEGEEEGESCGRIYQQRIEYASIGAGSEGCLTAPDNMALPASKPLTHCCSGKYPLDGLARKK